MVVAREYGIKQEGLPPPNVPAPQGMGGRTLIVVNGARDVISVTGRNRK
jgi:hypothetical protein